ncbi:nitronate monooxygenase [Pseudarthrobacter enclensis]|uniref:Propionate 3-nitronate monooxygenase n=1 Tax=Pseudarthrobacter enclensis TaxID=993070 RepID=A0ABT9RP69_9MICC|nr:nitronate monooxygenase [Pseudarthrobacter enclensis]MDP9887032.1 nitronate monooxygenase [Pseudarthrobacter enclensis]
MGTQQKATRFRFESLALPVIQAPMAGGPSTPQLAVAVSAAGGLGFLAAGYRTAAAMRTDIEAVRSQTKHPFGVNLFVPQPPVISHDDLQRYAASLAPDAERFGVKLGEPKHDDDDWDGKLEALLDLAPPVVSFTFDFPESGVVESLKQRGVYVIATVTDREEALRALAAGADALCVQGPEAGGHRGTFKPDGPPPLVPLHGILGELSDLEVPLIGAGGIATADHTRTALAVGAVAVQAGTAFLRAAEAGTKPVHRAALAAPDHFTTTDVTRVFSGRNARGLHNEFMRRHDGDAPYGYPEIHHLTTPLRAAAAAAGEPEWLNLWAGINYRQTMEGSAVSILKSLAP